MRLKNHLRISPGNFSLSGKEFDHGKIQAYNFLMRSQTILIAAIMWTLWGAIAAQAQWTYCIGLLGSGLLLWSFLEYATHRWILHADNAPSRLIMALSERHRHHHQYPRDIEYRSIPSGVIVLAAGSLAAAIWALTDNALTAGLIVSGTSLGYLFFEYVHTAIHMKQPQSELARRLRCYHLVHHYAAPRQAYGITSPLWDILFRTRPSVSVPLVDASLKQANNSPLH